MRDVLLVALGGAIGASARYGVGLATLRMFGPSLPWGTLLVNVLGGLAIGFLAAQLTEADRGLRALLIVGVLGGFTTFSSYSIELVRMLERGAFGLALGYAGLSTVLAVAACWAGLAAGRAMS